MPPTCEEVMREIIEFVLCRNFKVTTRLAQLPLGNVCVLVTQSCPALCDPMDRGAWQESRMQQREMVK